MMPPQKGGECLKESAEHHWGGRTACCDARVEQTLLLSVSTPAVSFPAQHSLQR